MKKYNVLTVSTILTAILTLTFLVTTAGTDNTSSSTKGIPSVPISPEAVLYDTASPLVLDVSASRPQISSRDGWEIIEFQDFEDVFPGADWVTYGETGYTHAFWDDSGCFPWAGDNSAFCAAAGTLAVECEEDYQNEMNAWMMYGPFDLSDADSAWFDWHFWLNVEGDEHQANCPDDLYVGISENSFSFLGWVFYSDECENGTPQNEWLFYGADLEDYVGKSEVWIGFAFRSNSSGTKTEGTHVDDIRIMKYIPVAIDGEDPSVSVLPGSSSLFQNYPNPFNPSTTISFVIPGTPGVSQAVTLTVYELRGRRVRTLIESELEPGTHEIHWDGRNDRGEPVSSGIYLYTLSAGDRLFTRKMAILK
jgi:hypothetical protein